jgi:hypothetical protein
LVAKHGVTKDAVTRQYFNEYKHVMDAINLFFRKDIRSDTTKAIREKAKDLYSEAFTKANEGGKDVYTRNAEVADNLAMNANYTRSADDSGAFGDLYTRDSYFQLIFEALKPTFLKTKHGNKKEILPSPWTGLTIENGAHLAAAIRDGKIALTGVMVAFIEQVVRAY